VLLRAFSIVLLWLALVPAATAHATTPVTVDGATPGTPPPTEFNEFYPDERPLSDCLSSLPKPNCGSEARGGWRQITILGVVLAALGFIAWRIIRSMRRAREPVSGGTGDADERAVTEDHLTRPHQQPPP
jgi:hypothetical protein